jgi:predicted GNAT family acetyltransferase
MDATNNTALDRYEVTVDGALAGILQYRERGNLVELVHTEVEPEYEGRGLAADLARTALDAARAEGRAVLPFCPYVNAYIKKHPEYVDLVPEAARHTFGL